MMNSETSESRKNDDSEICIYTRLREYQTDFIPHFGPLDSLISYHNKKRQFMWVDGNGEKEPKTGDICPICKRTILIYETTGH